MSIETISSAIRDINDFPKKGIVFKDVTPVLQSGELFSEVIDIFASELKNTAPDCIAAIESRGFIFGAALSYKLKCGFVPVRKKGKLPYKTLGESYELEYGTATIEIHQDAIKKGQKVLVLDDLLATGGTAYAAVSLVEKLGGKVIGLNFLMELAFLNGRTKLSGYPVRSLIVVN